MAYPPGGYYGELFSNWGQTDPSSALSWLSGPLVQVVPWQSVGDVQNMNRNGNALQIGPTTEYQVSVTSTFFVDQPTALKFWIATDGVILPVEGAVITALPGVNTVSFQQLGSIAGEDDVFVHVNVVDANQPPVTVYFFKGSFCIEGLLGGGG